MFYSVCMTPYSGLFLWVELFVKNWKRPPIWNFAILNFMFTIDRCNVNFELGTHGANFGCDKERWSASGSNLAWEAIMSTQIKALSTGCKYWKRAIYSKTSPVWISALVGSAALWVENFHLGGRQTVGNCLVHRGTCLYCHTHAAYVMTSISTAIHLLLFWKSQKFAPIKNFSLYSTWFIDCLCTCIHV